MRGSYGLSIELGLKSGIACRQFSCLEIIHAEQRALSERRLGEFSQKHVGTSGKDESVPNCPPPVCGNSLGPRAARAGPDPKASRCLGLCQGSRPTNTWGLVAASPGHTSQDAFKLSENAYQILLGVRAKENTIAHPRCLWQCVSTPILALGPPLPGSGPQLLGGLCSGHVALGPPMPRFRVATLG